MKKLNVFHNQCLNRGIFWPEVISNKELYKKTSRSSVVDQIRYRRIRWLGHDLHYDVHHLEGANPVDRRSHGGEPSSPSLNNLISPGAKRNTWLTQPS